MWTFVTFIKLSAALHLLLWNIVFCMAACNNAEYEINGQCCPMCDPGKRVYKHCDDNTSTTCVSCSRMTYTDSPNGLQKCLECYVCDPGNGLRVKQACTETSDTVCEPFPGHYCINEHRMSCSKAIKHSTCSPGQYINQTGTAFTDTVCKDCTGDLYSDGSFTSCRPHTQCESLRKITTKQGTVTSDAECRDETRSHLLLLIPNGILLCVIVLICLLSRKKLKCLC